MQRAAAPEASAAGVELANAVASPSARHQPSGSVLDRLELRRIRSSAMPLYSVLPESSGK